MHAALDDAAHSNNLGVSDDRVAAGDRQEPGFHRPSGAFDRERFTMLLDNAGIDRDDFVHDVRRDLVRGRSRSIGAGLDVPQPLVEALYR